MLTVSHKVTLPQTCHKHDRDGQQAIPTHLIILIYGLISTADLFLVDDLPRYGDMRKEIGFRIRDMWYNLGECMTLNWPMHKSYVISSL